MVNSFIIAIGAARAEGRQPSHDGEYLTVYYLVGGDDWLCESNAGLACSSLHDMWSQVVDANGDEEAITWAKEIDAEIAAGVRAGYGEPATSCGLAAADDMIENGWLTPDQLDGDRINQTSAGNLD